MTLPAAHPRRPKTTGTVRMRPIGRQMPSTGSFRASVIDKNPPVVENARSSKLLSQGGGSRTLVWRGVLAAMLRRQGPHAAEVRRVTIGEVSALGSLRVRENRIDSRLVSCPLGRWQPRPTAWQQGVFERNKVKSLSFRRLKGGREIGTSESGHGPQQPAAPSSRGRLSRPQSRLRHS
jgi:hypothetical protein